MSSTTKITPSPFIKLDRFLKWQGIAQTGGEAKIIVQQGSVLVNGEIETRRGRKLTQGDRVTVAKITYAVNLDEN
jgi:ribosome-associated protein